MDKPMSDIHFRLMSLSLRFRDFFKSQMDVVMEAGIRPGFQVLDFGCGIGSHTIIASELVGAKGKVYALDIHPLAINKVQELAARKKLSNLHTICSGCATGLKDEGIDVVLLYDVFHGLSYPNSVLQELHRVLRPDGLLSFSDHHMDGGEIVFRVTDRGLFTLSKKGRTTYRFLKARQANAN